MRLFRGVIAGLVLNLLAAGTAFAQCGTQAPANKFCGNDTGSAALATWKSIPPAALSPIAGGTVMGNRGTSSAVPSALTNPILGIPGTSTGEVGLAGATSGTATIRAQATAGSPILLTPTASGTLVSTATAPLAVSATTGAVSITGVAGGVLAGAGPAFTRTPVLGVPGTAIGTLGLAGSTSGTVTITPQATAGSPTLTLPNASGTFAVGASTPIVLSATTGGLTCPTCVTSSGGGAITGTAPISVSAAGVVSINAPYVSLTASNGGIVYSDATNLNILAGTATAGQIIRSGSSAAPSWSTATYPATTAAGTVMASSSANVVAGTATPVLGVAGSVVGTIGFQNATSGTITMSPPTGALGTVTLTLPAATDTLVARATTDNLTNKTYNKVTITAPATSATLTLTDGTTVTGPAASGTIMTLGNNETVTGVKTFGAAGNVGKLVIAGTTSGTTVLNASATASGTLTLPATTDTLVAKATTDTFTNKTFDSAGTGNVLQVSSVTVSRGQYPGTNTNDDATSGNAGEYGEIILLVGSATSISTGTPTNISTLTQAFGQGDWDIWLAPGFSGTSTNVQGLRMSISLTSGTEDAAAGNFAAQSFPSNGTFATFSYSPGIIYRRLKVTNGGSTTVFAVGNAVFGAGTVTGFGKLSWRRAR